MSKSVKKSVNGTKVGKKAKIASVPEKKVENKSEIEILTSVDRKSKLEAEMLSRKEKLLELTSNLDSGIIPLSVCEKILSIAFDCRNTARKLEKLNSPVIIA